MSSMNTAISGLDSAATSMNYISNNIANANTTGYKSMSAQYADMYSGGSGGGVYVANVSQDLNQGNIVYTSSTTDMAINGEGYFVLEGADGQMYYSRAGHFEVDKDNYLVNNQGLRLQGYPVDDNGNLITGTLQDVPIDTSDLPATTTSQVELGVNLDAREEAPEIAFDSSNPASYNSTSSTMIYDSQGNARTVTVYYVKSADNPNEWTANFEVDGKDVGIDPVRMEFDTNGDLVGTYIGDSTENTNGMIDISGIDIGEGVAPLDLTVNVSSFTQYGTDYSVNTNNQNGNPPGQYLGISISDDGYVYAQYNNGETKLQGAVVLADFPNENALEASGDTMWTATTDSGAALYGLPGTGSFGSMISGAVEQSNVDMTGELINMVVVQSVYQANAKMITTSNDMTQTLMQSV